MQNTNLDEADVIAMMDSETLLTAEESVEWGFATEIEDAIQMAANMTPSHLLAGARASAEIEVLKAQLKRAETTRDEAVESLQAAVDELVELKEGASTPTAMASTDVISLIMESGGPEWLATDLIVNNSTEEQVRQALAKYEGVRDACTAAGIENPDAVCRDVWSDTPALISALLLEAQALVDQDINTRQHPDGESQAAKMPSIDQVYASRKPKS